MRTIAMVPTMARPESTASSRIRRLRRILTPSRRTRCPPRLLYLHEQDAVQVPPNGAHVNAAAPFGQVRPQAAWTAGHSHGHVHGTTARLSCLSKLKLLPDPFAARRALSSWSASLSLSVHVDLADPARTTATTARSRRVTPLMSM